MYGAAACQRDRVLMGPGPLRRPAGGAGRARPNRPSDTSTPSFSAILDETQSMLRAGLRNADNPLTLPISATGSAGMETCFVNLA